MKIAAFGEVNMRLTPPEFKRIEQANHVDLSFTGTGLNILAGLHQFGFQTELLTILPNNRVGQAAASFIRKYGVKDTVFYSQSSQIGLFFAELGFGSRPTEVTYCNRLDSAFCTTKLETSQIEKDLNGVDWLHICGISLSTSAVSRRNTLKFVQIARQLGINICFDFNYRPSLNTENDKSELITAYKKVLTEASIVFGGARDLLELLQIRNKETIPGKQLFKEFIELYSIDVFAGTIKEKQNDKKGFKGFMTTKEGYVETKWRCVSALDRIGTGDAYAAGILSGFLNCWDAEKTVEFATTASELSYTTFGDSPQLSKDFVLKVMENSDIDIIR